MMGKKILSDFLETNKILTFDIKLDWLSFNKIKGVVFTIILSIIILILFVFYYKLEQSLSWVLQNVQNSDLKESYISLLTGYYYNKSIFWILLIYSVILLTLVSYITLYSTHYLLPYILPVFSEINITKATEFDLIILKKSRRFGLLWLIPSSIYAIYLGTKIGEDNFINTISSITTFITLLCVLFTITYYPYMYIYLKKFFLVRNKGDLLANLTSITSLNIIRNSYIHIMIFLLILMNLIIPAYNAVFIDGLLNNYTKYYNTFYSYRETRTKIYSYIDSNELKSDGIFFPIESKLFNSFMNIESMEPVTLISSKEMENILFDKTLFIFMIFFGVNVVAIIYFRLYLKMDSKDRIRILIKNTLKGLIFSAFIEYFLSVFRQTEFNYLNIGIMFVFIFSLFEKANKENEKNNSKDDLGIN